MKKEILTIIFSAVCLTAVLAQEVEKKNICEKGGVVYFDLGGGLNGISYKTDDYGTQTLGGGFTSRLGYRYYFTPNFGIGIGLSFHTLQGNAKLNFTETQTGIVDQEIMLENKTRDYHTEYQDLKERQKENLMSVPVGFFVRFPFGNTWKFNFGITGAYSLAFAQKFETVKGNFKTTADYTSVENGIPVNLNGVENLPKHGLNTYRDFKGDADLKQHLFNLGAETGFGYALTKNLDLNFGVYFNYVFSDQNNLDNALLYDHKTAVYNGATQTKITDNIHPIMLGAMIGLSYRFKKKQSEAPSYNCENEIRQLKNELEDLKRNNDDLRGDRDSLKNKNNELDDKNKDLEDKIRELESRKPEPQNPQTSDTDGGKNVPQQSFEELIEANVPIYFDLNSVSGDPELMKKMDNVASAMKSNPTRKIVIVGHTCDLGAHESNMRLSLRRAETLKQELIKRGVGPLRIRTVGVAEKDPIVPNTSIENRKLNRCAIIQAE